MYQEDPPEDRLMSGAAPFRLEGKSDTAILLVHGYEGSPFTMRGLAEVLHQKGFTVIAPLLPGHGTNIKDFAKTRYEHWYHKVATIYAQERPKYKNFFIGGFSLGGNLVLRTAINFAHSLPPTGIISISAPVVLNGIINGKILFKDWRLFFSGIISRFIPILPKRKEILAAGILSPWVGYTEAHATACVHSLKKHIGEIRPYLWKIRSPICLIQATNDRTISSENLHYIFRKVQSYEKRAFLFTIDENVSTRHVLITHEYIREKVYHYIEKFIDDSLKGFDLHPDIPDATTVPVKFKLRRLWNLLKR